MAKDTKQKSSKASSVATKAPAKTAAVPPKGTPVKPTKSVGGKSAPSSSVGKSVAAKPAVGGAKPGSGGTKPTSGVAKSGSGVAKKVPIVEKSAPVKTAGAKPQAATKTSPVKPAPNKSTPAKPASISPPAAKGAAAKPAPGKAVTEKKGPSTVVLPKSAPSKPVAKGDAKVESKASMKSLGVGSAKIGAKVDAKQSEINKPEINKPATKKPEASKGTKISTHDSTDLPEVKVVAKSPDALLKPTKPTKPDSKASPDPKTMPDPKVMPESKLKPDSKVKPDVKAAVAHGKPEPKVTSKPQAKPVLSTDAKSKAVASPAPVADAKIAPKAPVKAPPKVAPKPEIKPGGKIKQIPMGNDDDEDDLDHNEPDELEVVMAAEDPGDGDEDGDEPSSGSKKGPSLAQAPAGTVGPKPANGAAPTKAATPSQPPRPIKRPKAAPTVTQMPAGMGRLLGGSNPIVRKPLIPSGPSAAPLRPLGVQAAMGSAPLKIEGKSPFNKRELDRFQNILTRKRAELVGDVANIEDEALRGQSGSNSGSPNHMAEQGSENYEQSLSLDIAAADRRLIREVDDALDRIEKGTFGLCEMTGRPIKLERLEEIPWTRLSIEAAIEQERQSMRQ